MDKSINEWLLEYKKIKEIAETIYTEELPDEVETLALQRSGVEDLPVRYINEKCWYKQYQYILLLKSNSEDDIQRLNNLDWLDDLSNWIHQKNIDRDYPKIKNMKIKQVSCADAVTYETSEDGSISTYYIQLYFNVKGGI